MNIVRIVCSACNSSLETAENADVITCSDCGSRLTLEKTGDAVTTSVLELTGKCSDTTSYDAQRQRIEREIEDIDQQWRDCAPRKPRDSMTQQPSVLYTVSTIGLALVVGAACLAIVLSIVGLGIVGIVVAGRALGGSPMLLAIVPLLLVTYGVWAVVRSMHLTKAHQSRRAMLIAELNELGG